MNKREEMHKRDKSDGAIVSVNPLQGLQDNLKHEIQTFKDSLTAQPLQPVKKIIAQAHAQELTYTIMNGPVTDALDAQLELMDFIGNDGFKGLILDLITCDLRGRNNPLRAYPDRLAKLFECIVNDL